MIMGMNVRERFQVPKLGWTWRDHLRRWCGCARVGRRQQQCLRQTSEPLETVGAFCIGTDGRNMSTPPEEGEERKPTGERLHNQNRRVGDNNR